MTRRLPAACITLLLLACPPAVQAAKGNRFTVGPGGDFATIQEAVDAAQDGDAIRVDPGTYNESVVVAGKRDLTISGGRGGTRVIGTTSHAFEVRGGGGLSTLVPPDDTQVLPVGEGVPDSGCVDAGADGVCDSTADPGDDQVIPVGQGAPDSTCVDAGGDGVLDTAAAAGDDVLDAPGNRITSGPDGVCDTTADPGDDQTLPVGEGTPDALCIDSGADGVCDTAADPNDDQRLPVGQGTPDAACVGPGANGTLQSVPAGDDAILGSFIGTGPDGVCDTTAMVGDDVVAPNLEVIDSGPNGICDTPAGAGETQAVAVGNGDPDTDCVTDGGDGTLDTAAAVGDDVIDGPGKRITSGPDGVCDTTADPGDTQALPVGQGSPNGGCVTADEPLRRSRNVKIEHFEVQAPLGFDGVHVERSDFITIQGVTADGLGNTTGRHGFFVDRTAVKPIIKVCTARNLPPQDPLPPNVPNAGFFIEGPGAEISGCTAEGNEVGFLQTRFSDNALYVSNVAQANATGFGAVGQVGIFQRCIATGNAIGFDILGVGNILFQSRAESNGTGVPGCETNPDCGIGIRSQGRGTRVRSSAILNNVNVGVQYIRDPVDPEGGDSAEGSEVFASTLEGNADAGIQNDASGVVIRQNRIGSRRVSGRQDVGVHLQSQSHGTLLENNRIVNNTDVDGDVCGPAGSPCDLVNEGLHNAGRNNQFSPTFMPPEGFN